VPQIEIPCTRDAYVSLFNPDNNYGGAATISVGHFGTVYDNRFTRSFMYFDLSQLSGRNVERARLVMSYGVHSPNPLDLRISRVTQNWNEGTITWNNQPDINEAVSANFTESGTGAGWSNYDITNIILNILSGGANYGIGMRQPSNNLNTYRLYRSRETSDSGAYPKLRVDISGVGQARVSGSWRDLDGYARVSGSWREIEGYVRQGGVWRPIQ